MANKISSLSGNPATSIGAGSPAGKTRDAVTGGGTSSQAASSAPMGDVHITDSASQLAALEQQVRSLPAVDPVRVAHFSTAIEQGTYTAHPQQIADSLLQLEQALGQLPPEE